MSQVITPFTATGIGSMPFRFPEYACRKSLDSFPDAPFWPQLPRCGFNEDMVAQYAGGIPGVTIDFEEKVIRGELTEQAVSDMAEFYGTYLDIEAGATPPEDFCAITEESASGLHQFKRILVKENAKKPFIKVQTTGPCTFALGVKSHDSTPIFFSQDYRDLVVKALAMKCRWQIRQFAPFAEGIICFIDEPVLSAFGSSAYLGLTRDDVVAVLAETVAAIHAEGAMAALHCCGNTDWTMFVDSHVDIINFDSYEYGDTLAIYHEEIKKYMEAGGMVAWGAVPTSDSVRNETVDSLADRLEEKMDLLSSKGIDKDLIARSAMVTPACGTGSMAEDDAEKVFALTPALSRHMQELYGVRK